MPTLDLPATTSIRPSGRSSAVPTEPPAARCSPPSSPPSSPPAATRTGRRLGGLGAVLVLVLAACSGASSPGTPTGASPSGTSPSVGPSSAAPASVPASPSSMASASGSAGFDGPFSCPIADLTVTPPSNRLTGVEVSGVSTGVDRVIFTFGPAGSGSGAPPSLAVAAASPPFVQGASGKSLTVAGDSFVRLTFREMIVADDAGTPTYAGSVDLKPAGSVVREAVQAEAFEGVVQWIVGSSAPGCARLTVDQAGSRVVLDVRSP